MQSVSVVIPAINEEEVIGRVVKSAYLAGAAQVIVADANSSDDTCELAASAGATVVQSPAGRAVQQNRGSCVATGDVILFLHADGWISGDCLQQMQNALRDEKIHYGGFQHVIDHPGFFYRLIEKGNAARARWQGLLYGDQGIFVRRSTFQAVAGFPDVPLMEDVMLMRRLRHVGRPALLEGPLYVNPRRWERNGAIRQTARNWALMAAFRCGVSPQRLAKFYDRHDAA